MKSLRELYRIGSGPSSSHTMAPEAASNYVLSICGNATRFEATLYGSLALTGKGHFTDKIILKTLGEERTKVFFDLDTKKDHPNVFVIKAFNNDELIKEMEFTSTGGGEVTYEGKTLNSSSEVYPFKSFNEIKEYATSNNTNLEDVVYKFEDPNIKIFLKEVYDTMVDSINRGLNTSGSLPGSLKVKRKANSIYNSNELNKNRKKLIAYAYAVSEENASMGKIVTAPTCGSCGVLPAVLYYFRLENNKNEEDMINALAVAGLIGNTIKTNATISGAVAGCQAEIGSACSMASAAIAYLYGLSFEQIDAAAEIAMEHHLGLTCDPVDGLVQIPCIERNAVAALRAYDSSIMASLPIYPQKLTFDMVVNTMLETGEDLKEGYRETASAGLAKLDLNRE